MRIKETDFTIGADPEIFLKDKTTGRMVGAYGVVDGTKEKPTPIQNGMSHGYVQVDGMALEFNTTPSYSFRWFKEAVTNLVFQITNQYLAPRNLEAVIHPTAEFDDDEWDRMPEEVKVLGCNADYNGWTGKINPTPNAEGVKFRTGAGHIHIGWGKDFEITEDFMKVCCALTKENDATLGVASVLFDGDVKRRELYGKAGAFRPKPYGMEYRTPSNKWVGSETLQGYVWYSLKKSLENLMHKAPISSPEVVDIINNNKVDEAIKWLEYHKVVLPQAQDRVY